MSNRHFEWENNQRKCKVWNVDGVCEESMVVTKGSIGSQKNGVSDSLDVFEIR